MAIPAPPGADFIVVQADLAFGLLQACLDRQASCGQAHGVSMPNRLSQMADQGGGKQESSGGEPARLWPFLDSRGPAVKTPKSVVRGLRNVGWKWRQRVRAAREEEEREDASVLSA
jgi:hypothetical protein